MPEKVERLEQALRLWEDFCFLLGTFLKMQMATGQKLLLPHCGPLVHYAEFRDYLLHSYQRPLDYGEFTQKFLGPQRLGGPTGMGDMQKLPYALALWQTKSRRVYHLSSDIQCIFNATRTSNVHWRDVHLPFEAFAITLDLPIIGTTFNLDYDCILFSSYVSDLGTRVYELRLIPTKFGAYVPISPEEMKLMRDWTRDKKWYKLKPRILKYLQLLGEPIILPSFAINMSDEAQNTLVTESVVVTRQKYIASLQAKGVEVCEPFASIPMAAEGDAATKFLVNLCLFLSTNVRKAQEFPSRKISTPAKPLVPKSICSGTEISQVLFSHHLTIQETETFSEGLRLPDGRKGGEHGQFCSTYWRRGTWRFRPYQRLMPGAVKSVEVFPCLVLHNLLSPGELPAGSMTRIS